MEWNLGASEGLVYVYLRARCLEKRILAKDCHAPRSRHSEFILDSGRKKCLVAHREGRTRSLQIDNYLE